MKDLSIELPMLVERFESGLDVVEQLKELNQDEESINAWTINQDLYDFIFATDVDSLFLVGDNILDYFEKEEVIGLSDEEIRSWVANRIETLAYADEMPTFHFMELNKSVVSFRGESHGQAGIHFSDVAISRSKNDRLKELRGLGYVFDFGNFEFFPDETLSALYHKYVSERLN